MSSTGSRAGDLSPATLDEASQRALGMAACPVDRTAALMALSMCEVHVFHFETYSLVELNPMFSG